MQFSFEIPREIAAVSCGMAIRLAAANGSDGSVVTVALPSAVQMPQAQRAAVEALLRAACALPEGRSYNIHGSRELAAVKELPLGTLVDAHGAASAAGAKELRTVLLLAVGDRLRGMRCVTRSSAWDAAAALRPLCASASSYGVWDAVWALAERLCEDTLLAPSRPDGFVDRGNHRCGAVFTGAAEAVRRVLARDYVKGSGTLDALCTEFPEPPPLADEDAPTRDAGAACQIAVAMYHLAAGDRDRAAAVTAHFLAASLGVAGAGCLAYARDRIHGAPAAHPVHPYNFVFEVINAGMAGTDTVMAREIDAFEHAALEDSGLGDEPRPDGYGALIAEGVRRRGAAGFTIGRWG